MTLFGRLIDEPPSGSLSVSGRDFVILSCFLMAQVSMLALDEQKGLFA